MSIESKPRVEGGMTFGPPNSAHLIVTFVGDRWNVLAYTYPRGATKTGLASCEKDVWRNGFAEEADNFHYASDDVAAVSSSATVTWPYLWP